MERYGVSLRRTPGTSSTRSLNDDQRKRFEINQQLDFRLRDPERRPLRVNCYFQRGSISAAFRHIPTEIASLESLGLPKVLEEFARKPSRVRPFTGPTGSGKSTRWRRSST